MQPNAKAAGAPPQTPLWELTALPRPPSWFYGGRFAAGRSGEEEEGKGGRGREGRGSEREERDREGGEGEGRLTLMRSWNRAADWLRPALTPNKCFTSGIP